MASLSVPLLDLGEKELAFLFSVMDWKAMEAKEYDVN